MQRRWAEHLVGLVQRVGFGEAALREFKGANLKFISDLEALLYGEAGGNTEGIRRREYGGNTEGIRRIQGYRNTGIRRHDT